MDPSDGRVSPRLSVLAKWEKEEAIERVPDALVTAWADLAIPATLLGSDPSTTNLTPYY